MSEDQFGQGQILNSEFRIQNYLVSIIIPVYNKAEFIRETLDSALAQTFPHIELVLVNDGSTDGSFDILQEYKEKFPAKIQLIDSPNQGVSAATNLGMQASNGEYIQFLDADDLLSPDKISTQVNLFKGKRKASIATCSYVGFRDSINNYDRVSYGAFSSFESGLDLLLQFWNFQEMMAISSYLTPRELIEKAGPWDESLSINQDGEFFMRVLLHAKEVIYDPDSLVYYRTPGPSNVSQQKSEQAFHSLLASYQSYERTTLAQEDSNRVRIALKKVYQKFIYDCFPQYPDLIAQAEGLIQNLGVPQKTYIGGPKFQMLTKYLGFKNALRLKRFLG
ncbi:glycosyltransferase family A protein [Algoriphagus sp. CAU 1675]|uniref:glycosyltransferase family 2 protein n=1 Tax=Algoriphagus sp. CAU 1675 TaxID=3032597 RepID=UPI0023DBFDD0|nr:glycosyltransferase family A protein [Algoriphagus sp. CAU 1675]MDF2159400.1 glycosyltransferase family A protein [Algoriphagus sp. CAU 1675]